MNNIPRTKMRTMILIFSAMMILGCGAKKRVVHIDRGAEIVHEEKNSSSETTSHVSDIDTSKIKTKTAEATYDSVIEKWVWGKSGDPVSYTKTTISSGKVTTETEELKGLSSDSSATAKIADQSVLSSEVTSEVIDDNLEKESSSPFAWGGILLTILVIGIGMWAALKAIRYLH